MVSPLVELGYVARAHGIRGELRIVLHDSDSSALSTLESLTLGDERFAITKVRTSNGAYLVSVEGVSDRNRAEELRGRPVYAERDDLDLDEDEFLLADLVGCAVFLEDGSSYGEVVAVETGPQDRLVIVDGTVERLLPLVDEFIVDVDLENGKLVVAPPEGLPESEVSSH